MRLESDNVRDSQAALVDNMTIRYDWDKNPPQINLCKEHDISSTCSRFTEVVLQLFQGCKKNEIRSTVLNACVKQTACSKAVARLHGQKALEGEKE